MSDLFDCPLIIARFAVFVKGVTVVIVISIPDGYAYRWLCNELMKVRHPQDFYWFIMIFMSKDFSPFMKDCSGIASMFLSFLVEKFMKPFVNLRECNIHLVVELFISHWCYQVQHGLYQTESSYQYPTHLLLHPNHHES